MSRELAAVIFDVDGVLTDSANEHFESWRRLAADLGQELTVERFRATFGRQNRAAIPELFDIHDPDRVEELSEAKERYYGQIIFEHVTEVPGAATLVRQCAAAGWKCAVGSSGHPDNLRIVLKHLGISDFFDGIVSGHDVPVGKPDPAVFLRAAEIIDIRPEQCAVIEDAPAGIDAALAAGMTAIGITTEHPREKLSHAHLVVDALSELTPARLRETTSQRP